MDDIGRIRVTRAVIERDDKILAAQRSRERSFPLKWEFPGGKMEEGEAPSDCIVREIKEELGIDVAIIHTLPGYSRFHDGRVIEIIPFICKISGENPVCIEHEQIVWDDPDSLSNLDWADGDLAIYNEYIRYLNGHMKPGI